MDHNRNSASPQNWVAQRTLRYAAAFPDEGARLADLRTVLAGRGDPWSRKNLPGHLTAGAFVLDHDRSRLLLIHHRSLNLWVQPGGHLDPGELPPDAARREAAEETGLDDLSLHPWHVAHDLLPIDIDSHSIPANPAKGEAAHTHHDFRYVFIAPPDARVTLAAREVAGHQWVELDKIEATAPDLERAAAKLRRLVRSGG